MALGVALTAFGVDDIEGRSEFGLKQNDFQDIERAGYLYYAVRPYRNMAIGVNLKAISQSIHSASASGLSVDLGVWYGVPNVRRGMLDLALVFRDLGGRLKWEVFDETLNSEFRVKEEILTEVVFGSAYTSRGGHITLAVDANKTSQQDLRAHMGLEWATSKYFMLRAGSNAYDPTAGVGVVWPMGSTFWHLDYAFEYDLDELDSPHWVTLSLEFIPTGYKPKIDY